MLTRSRGIKTVRRDEQLAHIIKEKNHKPMAGAGTQGKTTTTGMMIWTMQQLGIPVSYSVGTTLSFGPSGKFDAGSEYFIYECDEFDRNFLHFQPYLSLITSIDYDHPDTYASEQDYLQSFKQFGEQSQRLIAWKSAHSELFINHPDAWMLDETLSIRLAGEHNRHNGTLVLKALEKLSIDGDGLTALENFPGTDRRFEKLGNNLYSDYGHHPVEIAATLQLAHELSDHIVLVYQPHQNIRQHEINDQYTDQFELAEKVYWLPTYLSREDPNLAILSPEELTKNIMNTDSVRIADLNEELWSIIQQARDADKLVLCMGAGSIDGWLRQRLNQ